MTPPIDQFNYSNDDFCTSKSVSVFFQNPFDNEPIIGFVSEQTNKQKIKVSNLCVQQTVKISKW